MVIAIIGSSGFIGSRIFQSLCSKQTFNLIGTYYKHKEQPEFIYLDVTSGELIEQFLVEYRPGLIFWIAGSKNINKCEDDWEYAYQINTQPINDYYEIKKRLNLETRLVFFSTDYVFDGLYGRYKDTNVVNPKTNYGISNKLAEDKILQVGPHDLIIRTSAAMGKGGQFFDWLTKSLVKSQKIKIYKDIYFSPTPIQLLSEASDYFTKNWVSGVVHICGGPRLSRFEFAESLMRLDKKFSSTIVPDYVLDKGYLFQYDLSLIQSSICKKFQTKNFENYILEELSK
jgi:dTDP-4-dehydrorhamnose reductase